MGRAVYTVNWFFYHKRCARLPGWSRGCGPVVQASSMDIHRINALSMGGQPAESAVILRCLNAEGFSCRLAANLTDAHAQLGASSFDVAIISVPSTEDPRPDDSAASDPLALFRALHTAYPHLPLMIIAPPSEEALAQQAVHEGAQDYALTDELLPGPLRRTLRRAIDSLHMDETVARGAREMSALYLTAVEINEQPEMGALLNILVQRAADLLNARLGVLYLVEGEPPALRLSAGYCLPEGALDLRLGPGEGLAGRIWQAGEPLAVPDYQAWEGKESSFDSLPFRRAVGAPLRARGRIVGVIKVGDDRCGDYTEEQVALLRLFADQAATAVQNARLHEATSRHAAHLEALNTTIASASSAVDVPSLISATLQPILQALNLPAGWIWLSEHQTSQGLPKHLDESCLDALHHPDWLSGGTSAIPDWPSAAREGHSPNSLDDCARRYGLGATLAVPIMGKLGTLGGLVLADTKRHDWAPGEIALAEAVGQQLGAAGDRLRMHEETQRRLREVTLLSRVIARTAAAEDTLSAAQALCHELAEFFQVPSAGFALLNEERSAARVIAEYHVPGYESSSLGVLIPVAGNASMTQILETKLPLAICEAQTDPAIAPLRNVMSWLGIRSILLVPILVDGEVVGTLGVNSLQARQFSAADVALAQHVASQAGLVLERLRLFRSAREHASMMESLAALSETLNRALSVDEVVRAAGQGALALSGAAAIAVFGHNTDSSVSVLWSSGVSTDQLSGVTGHLMPDDCVLRAVQPTLIPDLLAMPASYPLRQLAEFDGYRSASVWPLVHQGLPLAGFVCLYPMVQSWSDMEQEVLKAFARQAAVALENARLYQETCQGRDLLQAVMAASPDGITATDRKGNIALFNPAMESITGMRTEQVLGQSFSEVMLRVDEHLRQETGRNWLQEVQELASVDASPFGRLLVQTGPDCYYELQSLPIADVPQRSAGRINVWHDVTKAHELEHLRTDFTNMLVHDLRNPLSITVYALGLLMAHPEMLPEKRSEVLTMARGGVDQALKLISHLLELSRLESGSLPVQKESVDLATLLREAVTKLVPAAQQAGLTLEVSLPECSLPIVADASLLTRVVANLVDNAIRHTPALGRVAISARQVDGYFEFRVSDTGGGMLSDELETIFDRYRRGASTKGVGYGLGLAFCRMAVQAQGGRIWAESEGLGRGSTFCVQLPVESAVVSR
jgi:two-component system, NtrC family, sensor histidine kinase KinB